MGFGEFVQEIVALVRTPPVSYDEVYDALSYHVWKEPLGIKHELAAQRQVPSWRLTVVPVYSHLEDMRQDGLTERREATLTPHRLFLRGGKPACEYKLTEAGLRKRVEAPRTNGLETVLEPAPAGM